MSKRPTYSCSAPDQRRLKVARAEIEAILKKHDLAAVVTLHTPGMTEFFYEVRASYSCLSIDEQQQRIRVKSKLQQYGGDAARQRHDQEATANMAQGLAHDLNCAASMFEEIADHVNAVLRAEHTAPTFVPDAGETGPRQ